jgi:hypothetical protein
MSELDLGAIANLLQRRHNAGALTVEEMMAHGANQVVLFTVETDTYTHYRVAVIADGFVINDIIAAQS